MKYKQKLTKEQRKQISSRVLRWAACQLLSKSSFKVFETHLDIFENEALSRQTRESAARKIDQMINRRLKKHEQNK